MAHAFSGPTAREVWAAHSTKLSPSLPTRGMNQIRPQPQTTSQVSNSSFAYKF